MLTGKKLIIFDMDGTLIDSVGVWNAVDRILIGRLLEDGRRAVALTDGRTQGDMLQNDMRQETEEDLQQQRDALLRKFSGAGNPYMAYCAALREKYCIPFHGESAGCPTAEEIHAIRYGTAQDYLEKQVDYKEGADVLIRALKDAGYLLVIASTTACKNMEVYRTHNANIMKKADIDTYFDAVYTREDASRIKPDPEIYLRVMKEFDVSAKECLVFEDSLIGVEAAKNAGIETVAVYDRYSDEDRDAINALADHQMESYPALIQAIFEGSRNE